MFIYNSRFLTRGEVWFDDEPGGAPVDWIYYRQRSKPVARSRWKHFYTLLIDLQKSVQELSAEMEPSTVQKIRQAQEKDKTRWESCDPADRSILDEIQTRWNEFARARQSALFDRAWFEELIRARALAVSAGRDPRGEALSYHLAYTGRERAGQLVIVSQFRANPDPAFRGLVNRANCLGHWNTLMTLKERGLRHFDFGGWYTGTTDIGLLGMNAFKKSFGGRVVCEYDCEQIVTVKAWVLLTTRRFFDRVKGRSKEWHRASSDHGREERKAVPEMPARREEGGCRAKRSRLVQAPAHAESSDGG